MTPLHVLEHKTETAASQSSSPSGLSCESAQDQAHGAQQTKNKKKRKLRVEMGRMRLCGSRWSLVHRPHHTADAHGANCCFLGSLVRSRKHAGEQSQDHNSVALEPNLATYAQPKPTPTPLPCPAQATGMSVPIPMPNTKSNVCVLMVPRNPCMGIKCMMADANSIIPLEQLFILSDRDPGDGIDGRMMMGTGKWERTERKGDYCSERFSKLVNLGTKLHKISPYRNIKGTFKVPLICPFLHSLLTPSLLAVLGVGKITLDT